MLKILTIGNSFSDDTMEYVYNIAKSSGVKKIKLGNLYIGGCSLDRHMENAEGDLGAYEYRINQTGVWFTTPNYKMSEAIESEDWDFISLQQVSGYSGDPESFGKLSSLISYVRQHANPEAELIWNMTWAYAENSTHGDFVKYNNDQVEMYEAIVDTVEKKIEANKSFSLINPAGTAIQNARTSYIGDTLTRDGYHLSLDLGRYIAGLTLFYKLTGISIENLAYRPSGVDANAQKVAIESAINAVKDPKTINDSQYNTAPVIDLSNYTKLDIDWNIHSYWDSSNNENLYESTGVGSFPTKYCSTAKMTKTQIPVGSIIVIAEGWQYRPEGWAFNGTRPENVTASNIVVDEAWWGSYTSRSFNISKVQPDFLTDIDENTLNEIFIIYIPNN